jgi:hypothetical protein
MLSVRAHARYCSHACRQQAHRARKAIALKPHKAYQRLIREQLTATSPPITHDLDISSTTVRPIPLSEASSLILQYEWLGTMPAVSRYCFGIFFDDRLGGAVVYGDEYAENLGVWDRYG